MNSNAPRANDPVITQRLARQRQLFGGPIPDLWCPLLTHYTDRGEIDQGRMTAHFRQLRPWVGGFLVPGSTGDGWELSDPEREQVFQFVFDQCATSQAHLLAGILKPTEAEITEHWARVELWVKGLSARCPGFNPFRGFAVCPPRRATAEQMESALEKILHRGQPTALYQLPQMTENEMSPELIAKLAARFSNFILFKDSSGGDHVASQRTDNGIFFTRGAEGDYARWLRAQGGPYDGFLLSTANCFPAQLKGIIDQVLAGHHAQAQKESARITEVVNAVFTLVKALPQGNAFANANKAIDHFNAYGPNARRQSAPRLHAGSRLPPEIIEETEAVLRRADLLPARGYL
jgi:dihydrodipicolinate synthase/N-acetylneuraminate lyase